MDPPRSQIPHYGYDVCPISSSVPEPLTSLSTFLALPPPIQMSKVVASATILSHISMKNSVFTAIALLISIVGVGRSRGQAWIPTKYLEEWLIVIGGG